jgi:hypothetical protein
MLSASNVIFIVCGNQGRAVFMNVLSATHFQQKKRSVREGGVRTNDFFSRNNRKIFRKNDFQSSHTCTYASWYFTRYSLDFLQILFGADYENYFSHPVTSLNDL